MTMFKFLSILAHFIPLYLCVFFAHTEEMAFVCDEIDIKDEPLFPSSECDQVCSVFFMNLIFIVVYHMTRLLFRKRCIKEGTPLFELKDFYTPMAILSIA